MTLCKETMRLLLQLVPSKDLYLPTFRFKKYKVVFILSKKNFSIIFLNLKILNLDIDKLVGITHIMPLYFPCLISDFISVYSKLRFMNNNQIKALPFFMLTFDILISGLTVIFN